MSDTQRFKLTKENVSESLKSQKQSYFIESSLYNGKEKIGTYFINIQGGKIYVCKASLQQVSLEPEIEYYYQPLTPRQTRYTENTSSAICL